MATFIIAPLFGKKGFSAFNEATGKACWQRASVKDVTIDFSSSNSDQPVAGEQTSERDTFINLLESDISTLKIIQPSRVKVTMFCTDSEAVESVIGSFSDTRFTMTINTKGITANNLVVVDAEISQTPEVMSAVKIVVNLEQAAPRTTAAFDPAQTANASVTGTSIQTPIAVTANVINLYNKVINILKGI